MEKDEVVKIWVLSLVVAVASYLFASIAFTGILDLMALGGFVAMFGLLMIAATLIERRL